MKAAVLVAPNQPLQVEDISIAKPGPHEVLIRTAACGLCHSDLHFIEGTYPHALPAVPGHEAAGVVEAVGSEVRTVKPGDHVVSCLSAFCGHCEFCVTGRMALCLGADTRRAQGDPARLSRPDGSPVAQMLNLSAFAEQMLIHEHACVRIDPDKRGNCRQVIELLVDAPTAAQFEHIAARARNHRGAAFHHLPLTAGAGDKARHDVRLVPACYSHPRSPVAPTFPMQQSVARYASIAKQA